MSTGWTTTNVSFADEIVESQRKYAASIRQCDLKNLTSGKTFLCASVFLLLYDHVLTISDEVWVPSTRTIVSQLIVSLLDRLCLEEKNHSRCASS